MLYKNVASQKLAVFAYTASTGVAKTGDAAQITAYISKDFAAGAATNDVNPAELDATNMPGWYVFDLTQAETNAEVIVLAPKSSTSGVVLDQAQVFTQDAAISSRASQTSVDDVPTNAELATALAAADDTVLAAIADVPTVAEFEARTLVAADYVVVTDTIAGVTAVGSVTGAVGSVTGAVGSVAAGVTLADDAITAAKYDENTAYPLKSADTGATALARTGAESDTLETLSDQLDAVSAPSAADVADAVWDEALAGHAGAGTTGEALAGATAPSAGTVADAVWDELLAGHVGVGTAGAGLAAAGSAGDPWSTPLPGTYGAGTAGKLLSDKATAAALAVVDANVDAVKLITDQLDVSSVIQVTASSAGHLTITAGLTFDEGVTGLTIPSNWVAAIWTLKYSADQADTAAVLALRAENPAAPLTDGLQRVNGAALVTPITLADGALTVTQASGTINVWLSDELTVLLGAVAGLGWDVKFIDGDGDSVGTRGTANVVLTETKATV